MIEFIKKDILADFNIFWFRSNNKVVVLYVYKRTKHSKLERKLWKRKLVKVFEGIERKEPIFYNSKKMGTYKRAVARFCR